MKHLSEVSHPDRQWKGYTMEDLMLRRAEIYARREIEKYRLQIATSALRENTPMLNGAHGFMSKASSWFTYLEYALVAFRMAKRITPLFRRK